MAAALKDLSSKQGTSENHFLTHTSREVWGAGKVAMPSSSFSLVFSHTGLSLVPVPASDHNPPTSSFLVAGFTVMYHHEQLCSCMQKGTEVWNLG
jgi:hypothetical protein